MSNPSEETLDSLLKEAEVEVKNKDIASTRIDKAILSEIEAIEGNKTDAELLIQRDILDGEIDLTRKLEAELWNGAHIVCFPFFYDTYTVRAQIEAKLQEKYNHATIATCSRFRALGQNGLAMVTPIIDYIRNHRSYVDFDMKTLDRELVNRVVTWLRLDIMPETRPRPFISRSMEKVLSDIEEAEAVFARSSSEAVYMEGEAQLAAIKAIRNSAFLPSLVKIRLLQALKGLTGEEITDIGTFLLWEIRKSSRHHNRLLYTMLKIFKALSSSLK